MIGFFGLQTLAIDHLPSGYASLLLYLQPVLTVLLAAPLLGEALTPARLVGALTAFVGVAVVSLHPDRTVTTVGIALGVAAAVCWSLGTITAKRVRPRVEPLWRAFSFLVPVVAVALGWWLLDESLGWSLVIGTRAGLRRCAPRQLVPATLQVPQTRTAVRDGPPEIGTHARSVRPRLTANVEP